MNRGAAGCEHLRQGARGYRQFDNQATSSSRWSHRVSHVPSDSKRHLTNNGANHSARAKHRSVAREQSIDYLIRPNLFRELKNLSDRRGKRYNGKEHSKYATEIKRYTASRNNPLNHREQNRLIPWLKEFKPQTHWSWFSLTTVTHSFTSAGVFTLQPHSDQAVRHAQQELLSELLHSVRYICNKRPQVRGIDTMGIANLLWSMAKLVDNGQNLTPDFKETVGALLHHVIRLQNRFNRLDIAILMWSMGKLVDKGLELTSELKEVVLALLSRIYVFKDHFNMQGVSNLVWAMVKLVLNGLELTSEFIEVMDALWPRVRAMSDQFNAQAVANLLWAMVKLVDNGLEMTTELKEAIAALLPRVQALTDQLEPQVISNIMWAIVKAVDNGQELTPELKETAATLLLRVHILQAQFSPQDISSVLWAAMRLVDSGQELISEFKMILVDLLPRMKALKALFSAQSIVNLLWAVAKLVEHTQVLTPESRAVVAIVLPQVKVLKVHFDVQDISSVVWAIVKLVVGGLELTTPALQEALVALLPQVKLLKDQFCVPSIACLFRAVAKLVDYSPELSSKLAETVIILLPRVNALKAQCKLPEITNVLWVVAKLVCHGLQITPQMKEILTDLSPGMSVLNEQFDLRLIVKLLWATGCLGDLISTAAGDPVARIVLRDLDTYLLFPKAELLISLWGMLVCAARHYLDNNISDKNAILEYLIDRLFTRLKNESPDSAQCISVMAYAASWLGRKCPVVPDYQTSYSAAQSTFCTQLQSALPSLKIEQEKSLRSLSPVDLFLPGHNIVIEIQGPLHYIGGDFQTRNGSTLLKIALLQKAGYDVLEIPVNQLANLDSVKTYIAEIQLKTGV